MVACERCGKATSNPRFCGRSCATGVTGRHAPKHGPKEACAHCRALIPASKRVYDARRAALAEAEEREYRHVVSVRRLDGRVEAIETPRVAMGWRFRHDRGGRAMAPLGMRAWVGVVSALFVAACAGGASAPRAVRGGPDAGLAPRIAVRHVADQSSTLDVVQDASTGLPAISADGAHVAFLFNDAAISTLSSLTFQIASTKTGKVEEAFPIVTGEDVLRELEDHEGKLIPKVDEHVRVANELLAGGRYEPMLVARGLGAPGASLNVGDLESVLDGGRFKVRRAGVVQIDVDASGWADKPIGLGPTCTIRAAATLLAVDARKATIAVVIEQIGEGGSDACGGPRSVKVFALRSP